MSTRIKLLNIPERAYCCSTLYTNLSCNLVAPLTIHSNATVASGSTITEDVPPDKLTIARSKQVTVKNWKGPKHLRDDQKE